MLVTMKSICSLDKISLLPWKHCDEEGSDYLFNHLQMSRNPKFSFRVGILNPCHPKPGFKIATCYLIKAFEGHYPRKYVLAIMNICSRVFQTHVIGTSWLYDLWNERCLQTCRMTNKETSNERLGHGHHVSSSPRYPMNMEKHVQYPPLKKDV